MRRYTRGISFNPPNPPASWTIFFFFNGERTGLAALQHNPTLQEVGTSRERLIPLKSLWLTPLPPPQLDSVTLSPAPER